MSGHLAYVGAAYGVAAVIIGGLVVWAFAGLRRERRTLRDLETRLGRRDRDAG